MPENREGWHQPEQRESQDKSPKGVWYTPAAALNDEQLAELRQSPPPNLPEPEVGASPAQTGAWYRPDATENPTEEGSQAGNTGLFDYISRITAKDEGEFDPSKSKKLQGIDLDATAFDDSKSGALGGIGAEAEPAIDESKSGALAGLLTEDLGEFDDTKSGALGGITEEEPAFDDSKSGALAGLQESTEAPRQTEALNEPQMQEVIVEQLPEEYAAVEAQVTALRQQFANGEIDRQQLQDELRKLMVIDDAGRWWMLGLESNKWYRYDGKDWIPDNPPMKQVVVQQAMPTETGMQEVVANLHAPVQDDIHATELPLPSRVPVADPNATLVNQRAFELEDHRSWEAPTMSTGLDPTENLDSTLPHAAPVQGDYAFEDMGGGAISGLSEPMSPLPPQNPKSRQKMDGIQPDYSAAFDGYWDRSALQKWGLRVGGISAIAVLFITLAVVLALVGYYLSLVSKYTEAIDTLGDRAASFETTIVYDSQGNVIAEFNDPTGGTRKSVPLDEISPYLIHATIATEDETYYENPGFSLYGIVRAVYQNLRTSGGGGGASTITQQLARAIVLDPEFASQRSYERKIEEIVVAAEIARQYSKNEILQFYLNEIYYGNQAYGIEAAAEVYFQKSASQLEPAEAALLAGLPQAPALYDPVVNRQAAVLRMDAVLRLMQEANGNGCIRMQHAPYNTQPFCFTEDNYVEFAVQIAELQGLKTFTPPRYDTAYPHFVNYVRQELEREYGSQRIYSSGFRVYTTIVPSAQNVAQRAVVDEIAQTPGANNGAVIAIRPRDGAVLVMVGSADFNNVEIRGQVNVLFTPQQPGSSIKPLVYVTAFEGVSENNYWYPGTVVWDVPSQFPPNYVPRNFSGTFTGPVSVRYALGQSLNIPAIKALAYVNPDRFAAMLNRIGVQQPGNSVQDTGLPAAVGGMDIYPFELGNAYAVLANNGVRHNPYAITRIEDVNGNVVYETEVNPQGVQIIRPEHAYLITDMLSDQSVRYTNAMNIPGWRGAAKTGTTNDNRDVWTGGYTTEAAVLVWVGRTDNQPMASTVLGSNTAAPIWNKTMQALLAGITPSEIPVPPNLQRYQVCVDTGAIFDVNSCPSGESRTEIAFVNQQPPNADQGFLTVRQVDSFSNLLANDNCPNFVTNRTFANLSDLTAIEWLNNNPVGQAWAGVRGIQLPLASLPTESCFAGMPQPQVVIAQPSSNQEVGGLTNILGTVSAPGFSNFEFQIANAENPDSFTLIGQVISSQQPNPNAPLTTLDFGAYPNGNYILKLLVRGQNNAEASVNTPIRINNAVILPTTTPAPTLTPPLIEPTLIPTTDPSLGGILLEPTANTDDPFQAVPPPGN